MDLWVTLAFAEPMESGASLPLAARATPEEQIYEKVVDAGGGKVEGRGRRRRDGPIVAWTIPTTEAIVRYDLLAGGKVAERHLFDAAGYPLASVTFEAGQPKEGAVNGATVPLAGFAPQVVPGGKMALPAAPGERPGGGARLEVLGGRLDVWTEPATDPATDAFRDGLLAGCGCFAIDRATAWVDGRPGVRYRLLLPGNTPRDAVDLWAVPRGDGLWLMSWTVTGTADPIAALAPARLLVALTELEGAP